LWKVQREDIMKKGIFIIIALCVISGCFNSVVKIKVPAVNEQEETVYKSGTIFKVSSCYKDRHSKFVFREIEGFVPSNINLADDAIARQILREAGRFSFEQKVCPNFYDDSLIEVFLYCQDNKDGPGGWEVMARSSIYQESKKIRWVEYINYPLRKFMVEKEKKVQAEKRRREMEAGKAKASEKTSAEFYLKTGNAYAKKGQYDQAIADFTKALEINPWYADAYSNRGVAYLHKGQYDRAIADYTKALEINPRYAEACFNRGNLYYKKGQYDKAIADFTKAVELNPRYAEAYSNRGVAYDDTGQYDKAIADYTKALEINPRYASAYAYNNRGVAYLHNGQYNKAIADFNKALEINPRVADAYYYRGVAYDDTGQYNKAIADYTKALEINPRYASAYFKKAILCEKAGRIRESIEAYRGFIQCAPPKDVIQIIDARERIKQLEGKQ
jgi:tetratricopeptide (TPR) repeat protein